MSAFHLVQRLVRRDTGQTGFDGIFGCEYMGSAEFEWGAIPESLKRIRGSKKIVIHEGVVTRGDITKPVYVVGPKSKAAAMPDLLTTWLADPYPRGKEMSHFPEQIDGTASDYHRANAWWALNEDVMWTLDRTIADDLLRAVRSC